MRIRLALLVLAVVGVAAFSSACSSGGGGQGASGGRDDAAEAAGGAEGEEGAAPGSSLANVAERGAVPQRGVVPAVGPRVVQTATLRVSVPRGELPGAIDEARSIAAGLGGFVVGSTSSRAPRGGIERGSLTLRVPAGDYAAAMRSLARIGRIEAQEETGTDVSQEFVDLEARRRHLAAVERQLLTLLERAASVPAALAVQSQLNETQLQLEQVRGRLRYLEDRTAYATITLGLRERDPAAADAGDEGWGVVDAWRAGARAFVFVAGRVFVVVAAAAPFVALLGLAFLAARVARRRWLARPGASRP